MTRITIDTEAYRMLAVSVALGRIPARNRLQQIRRHSGRGESDAYPDPQHRAALPDQERHAGRPMVESTYFGTWNLLLDSRGFRRESAMLTCLT